MSKADTNTVYYDTYRDATADLERIVRADEKHIARVFRSRGAEEIHYNDGSILKFRIRTESSPVSKKKYWRRRPSIRNDIDGEIFEEVATQGDWLWLKTEQGDEPRTYFRDGFTPYTPPTREVKVGDIWMLYNIQYRCLGVDEVRKLAHWVKAEEFHDGDWPRPLTARRQVEEVPKLQVYTRELPELFLEFVRTAY